MRQEAERRLSVGKIAMIDDERVSLPATLGRAVGTAPGHDLLLLRRRRCGKVDCLSVPPRRRAGQDL